MILVTGGTGVVGSAIVAELQKQGQSVAVMGRDAARIQRAFGGSVDARAGDVTRPQTLAAPISGIDTVINAVQFPTSPIEVPRRGWTFENVDYKGTVNQVEAAKTAGVKRFVFVSAVGADLNGPKHWFRFKAMAETTSRTAAWNGPSSAPPGFTVRATTRLTGCSASPTSCPSCRCSETASRTCSRSLSTTSAASWRKRQRPPRPPTSSSSSAARRSCRWTRC